MWILNTFGRAEGEIRLELMACGCFQCLKVELHQRKQNVTVKAHIAVSVEVPLRQVLISSADHLQLIMSKLLDHINMSNSSNQEF